MGKSTGIGKRIQKVGNDLGQKIGAGYAEQGKSWGEISSMPSSGGGFLSDSIRSGAKTAYDNYMANNSSTSSNMIQASRDVQRDRGRPSFENIAKALYGLTTARNNRPASGSTSSANMIQSPGGSDGGLAASALGTPNNSQGSAQSMNVNPMLNNSIGSLGQNNTGGTGLSSGLAASGIRQPWSQYGAPNGTNEYDIMDGVKLI